jgi:uncharacterized protein (TIGR02145 family)
MLFVLAALTVCNFTHAQTTISLTFTATNNGLHQPLDSINIQNLSQGGDTTLTGSDTILQLDHGIGINEWAQGVSDRFILYPVTPNPVGQHGTIRIFLPQPDNVVISLSDLSGHLHTSLTTPLQAGHHVYTFTPGGESVYMLSVRTKKGQQTQKIISLRGSEPRARVDYSGFQENDVPMKKGIAGFPWAPGDQLRFIGHSATDRDTIHDNPVQSILYTFHLISTVSPPAADFSVNDTLLQINDTAYFTDLSIGNPTAWKWYFGDGDSSSAQHPFHVYTSTGQFTVTLHVTNQGGNSTTTKQNHIKVSLLNPYKVYDVDGNGYDTLHIGTQVWMKQNLRVTRYSNGAIIPKVTGSSLWTTILNGAYCWYLNDSVNYGTIYGALYNYKAVEDPNGLCPTGWHVPSDLEWQTLEMFLGMSQAQASASLLRGTDEGGKLKETGFTHWNSPNTGATDSIGFTALPGGYRDYNNANYYSIGNYGYWWTSTSATSASSLFRRIYYDNSGILRNSQYGRAGYSVRCVMD